MEETFSVCHSRSNAGIQKKRRWVPACAGMTDRKKRPKMPFFATARNWNIKINLKERGLRSNPLEDCPGNNESGGVI